MKIRLYEYEYGNLGESKVLVNRKWSEFKETSLIEYDKFNFPYGNGINTSIVINLSKDKLDTYINRLNYLTVEFENDGGFVASYYIVSYDYNRRSQYILHLRRDVVADYVDDILNAKSFVNRGYISDLTNPLLYKPEPKIKTNMIKQEEYKIADGFDHNTDWILLYTVPDKQLEFSFDRTVIITPDYEVSSTSEIPFFSNDIRPYGTSSVEQSLMITNQKFSWRVKPGNLTDNVFVTATVSIFFIKETGEWKLANFYDLSKTPHSYPPAADKVIITTELDSYPTSYQECFTKVFWKWIEEDASEEFINGFLDSNSSDSPLYKVAENFSTATYYEGKTWKLPSGTIYRLKLYSKSSDKFKTEVLDKIDLAKTNGIDKLTSVVHFREKLNNSITLIHDLSGLYVYEVVDASEYEEEIEITGTINTGLNTGEQPWSIIAIPTSEDQSIRHNGKTFKPHPIFVKNIVGQLISKYTGETPYIYDVQYIHYTPDDIFIEKFAGGGFNSWNFTQISNAGYDVDSVYSISEDIGMAWVRLNRTEIMRKSATVLYDGGGKKSIITNEYRLSTGNYNNPLIIDIARNGGTMEFYINMDLRPITPFIQLKPEYKFLNGVDFKDLTGSILTDDIGFSLVSSAWETYKRQNVNYQQIFNAQQDYERSAMKLGHEHMWREFGVDAAFNTVGSTLQGAGMGMAVGGSMGAAIGGGVGLVKAGVDIAGEASNVAQQQKFDTENLALAQNHNRNQWELNLGNIKALPLNLSKVQSRTFITKPYFIVEKYSSTEEEKLIVDDYLRYNGYTIEAIGSIKDYLNTDDRTYIVANIYDMKKTLSSSVFTKINETLSAGIYFLYDKEGGD